MIFLSSVTNQLDKRTTKPDMKDCDKGRLQYLLKISPVPTDILLHTFIDGHDFEVFTIRKNFLT